MPRAKSVIMTKAELATAKKDLKGRIADLKKESKTANKDFAAAKKLYDKAATARAKELAKTEAQLAKFG